MLKITKEEVIHMAIGAIGIVIDSHENILLVKSVDRGWHIPGGFSNVGEAPSQALIRELREETGYDIEISKLTGVYHCVRNFPILTLAFLCKPISIVSETDNENIKQNWFNISKARSLITYKSHSQMLNAHVSLFENRK